MNRSPLSELIVQKPRPETTLSLVPAVRDQAAEMVESYVFTETIRHYFAEILETVARGQGQGFWVQAEYGAGKTHFLAALASLLANHHGAAWDLIQDPEIGRYRGRLQASRLFPVVISLRGMGNADGLTGRSLLDVILEDGFQPALDSAGLHDQVQVVAADDYVAWLAHQTAPAIRQDIETFVRSHTGYATSALREMEGTGALARWIAMYCQENAIDPKIAAGVKNRLAHIYRQLVGLQPARYTGLLVVIDEYEGWEKAHANPATRAHDEDVLETLAYLLPRDLGYQVYTIVASQSAVPAKLQGGQSGDRFINIPLLATANERDYDVIVARRVRGLHEDRGPEISDHFLYVREHFDFANHLTEAEFRDIFPFQPRCFEVVRHITARDLPTARSGITIFHEVVNDARLLDGLNLIRVADLLHSPHLVDDCLATPVYREAFNAYKVAKEALPTLELDQSDQALAQAILDTLFLWHLAYQDHPRALSLKELAQATLTTSDFLRAEDNVAYVLGQLQSLRQVHFEGQHASFVPAGGEGVSVVTLFNEYRRRAQANVYELSSAWSSSLFFNTAETRSQPGVFASYTPNEATSRRFEFRYLDYAGHVIVGSRWQFDWGMPLPKDDLHFRVVFLTADAAQSVNPQDLQDPRIAVIYPAALSEETTRVAVDFLAWRTMVKDYAEDKRVGKEADAVREWLSSQRNTVYSSLVQTHLRQYQAGRIVTRDELAIDARDVLGVPAEDRRLSALVEKLLAAAYPQLPIDWSRLRGTLRTAEVGRVFGGYFARHPGTAEQSATRNFGVALGLSHPEKPGQFAPQQAAALGLIAQMLAERRGELPVWRIYEMLAAPPYGLPYALIHLYVLAFVRQGNPRAEIILKRDHKLQTQNRQPFPASRLTASNVVDLDFKPGLDRAFDTMVEAAGPAWNDTVAYAREIEADLRATTNPDEVEEQAQQLSAALHRLGQDVETTHRTLTTLQKTLDSRLAPATLAALDRLAALVATADEGYASFFAQAAEQYTTPDALRDQQRTVTRLKALSNRAVDIAAVKDYLDRVQLRPGDRELAADRLTIQGRLNLDSLAAQPDLWPSVRGEFEAFRARYRNAYQKHHRDTQAEQKKLRDSLTEAQHQLATLTRLNRIHELGPAVGEELGRRYAQLLGRLQPCPVPLASLELESTPTCQCGLTLTSEPLTPVVESFLKDLQRALRDQQRRLASEAIRRILARSDEDRIMTFVQVVQAADLAAFVDVLDDELATFVQVLLAEEEVAISPSDLLRRFADAYPTLEEADLAKAVRDFERLLREAFAEARQSHADKKTVRLTLK